MNLNAINKRIQIEISSIRKKVINKNHIVFELEADSTIPSEYIIMMHFFGEIDIKLEKKLRNICSINKIKMEDGHYFMEETQI